MNHLQQLERKSRLWHIERAAREIQEFTAGRSLEDYETDRILALAVERQFTIIGEALQRAMQVDPELVTKITDARGITNLRHQLAHNYPNVSAERIWRSFRTTFPSSSTKCAPSLPSDPHHSLPLHWRSSCIIPRENFDGEAAAHRRHRRQHE